MKLVSLLLLFVCLPIITMQKSELCANFEVTTMQDQTKIYKCLLCKYRPVARETSLLNHWVQEHNTTYDYTMEVWKEVYARCTICNSYHPTENSLKLHILRNHRPGQKKTGNQNAWLERTAICTLYKLAQQAKNNKI